MTEHRDVDTTLTCRCCHRADYLVCPDGVCVYCGYDQLVADDQARAQNARDMAQAFTIPAHLRPDRPTGAFTWLVHPMRAELYRGGQYLATVRSDSRAGLFWRMWRETRRHRNPS